MNTDLKAIIPATKFVPTPYVDDVTVASCRARDESSISSFGTLTFLLLKSCNIQSSPFQILIRSLLFKNVTKTKFPASSQLIPRILTAQHKLQTSCVQLGKYTQVLVFKVQF